MDCIDLVLFSWSVLLLALVAKPSQPVWPIQMAFFLSQFWSIRFESSLLNSTLKHITYTVLPIQTFIKGVYSVFSAFSRAETTTSGSGNFSLRGGPFFIPDHRQTSVGEESNGLNKRKGDKRHFTQIDPWTSLPFSPSNRITSKLLLRGFWGFSTTVRSGQAARRATLTPSALRPYTRQLLLP